MGIGLFFKLIISLKITHKYYFCVSLQRFFRIHCFYNMYKYVLSKKRVIFAYCCYKKELN